MATSSLANLFSLFNPSKPPPSAPPSRALKLPPIHLSAASDTRPGWEPLVLSNEAQSRPSCSAVVCPSLAHANTMFFRSAYNVQVIVDDNEPRRSCSAGSGGKLCAPESFRSASAAASSRTNRRRRSGGLAMLPSATVGGLSLTLIITVGALQFALFLFLLFCSNSLVVDEDWFSIFAFEG